MSGFRMRKKARQSTQEKSIREVSSIYGPVFWELKPSSSQVSRPSSSYYPFRPPSRPNLLWALPKLKPRLTAQKSPPKTTDTNPVRLRKSESWNRETPHDRPLTDRPKPRSVGHRRTVTNLMLGERMREELSCDPRRRERRSLPARKFSSRGRLRTAELAGQRVQTAGEVNPSPWGGESTTTEGVSLSFSLQDYKGE